MTYIDLKGEWDVCLDESKAEQMPHSFDLKIKLPDTTSNACLGKINTEKNYGCLTDLYKFEGRAWYRRSFYITPEQAEQNITLFLERTRKTCVYVDGEKIGEYCSLCAPHRYALNGIASGEHELVICVDNTDYPTKGGHLTSQDTQTNWNGIMGEIAIFCYKAYPEKVLVMPDVKNKTMRVSAEVSGEKSGFAQLRIFDEKREYGADTCEFSEEKPLECIVKLNEETPLWSEQSPDLLNLEIMIGEDIRTLKCGLRNMTAEGLKLKINGEETFLRGKHDGLIFPRTGFAPIDFESWKEVFEISMQYGINHYRFHTCCPPEAAFEAADFLGIYLQPELPFWGNIPEEPDAEFEFLREEGFRILREFGHHPSFVMMSLGNELWGCDKALNETLKGYKEVYPDKLFTQGSNNFQFVPRVLEYDDFFSGVRFSKERLIRGGYASCDVPFGHIQSDEPNSSHNYDKFFDADKASESSGGEILIQYGTQAKKVRSDNAGELTPDVPVISHEIGQYYIYPDYDEIKEYTGSLRHDTYSGYEKIAEEKGFAPYTKDFFKASGALAVDCYRREIEAALRSEKMAGFQLLDLQDFPGQGTATVGILNAFMESKGLITPENWRKFCNKTVVLAEFDKFIFTSGEKISCKALISNTDPEFVPSRISWTVSVDGKIQASGVSNAVRQSGRITYAEDIAFTLDCKEISTAVLELNAGEISNSYTLYIYPQIQVEITENEIKYNGKTLKIVRDESECDASSLCIPNAKDTDLHGEYCTDFWCYGMFKNISESMGKDIPTGTLGLLIDDKSEMLKGFPCENHTTPQWYEIISHSFCADLNETEIIPDVWVIDNPLRASRLALLYKKDGKVICTSRLWEIADRIEVKHFAASLVTSILG